MQNENEITNNQILARSHKELKDRVDIIEITVDSHTDVIAKLNNTHEMMHEMLEIFKTLQGGLKVIGWLGIMVKWVWPLVVGVTALWIFVKTGKWEIRP